MSASGAKSGNKAIFETATKHHASKVRRRLKADYPEAECALNHKSAFQLLIATILSAQCTDERVNIVTKDLFRKYKTPYDFASAPIRQLEKAIQSTGFFRNKAKNIKACSMELVEKFDGEIPQDMEALVALPGVGRKTGQCGLGNCVWAGYGSGSRYSRGPT